MSSKPRADMTPEELEASREHQRQLAAERDAAAVLRKASAEAWQNLHPLAFKIGRHIEVKRKAAPIEDGLVRSEAADLVGGANTEAAE